MADIYVATTGNDTTGDGSSGNPYASPGKAAGVMGAGDIMRLKSGTYVVTSTTANVAGGRVAIAAGSSGTWKGMQGYNTTIDDYGTPPVIQAGGALGTCDLWTAANFVYLSNVEFDGNSRPNVEGATSNTTYGPWRCIFRNFIDFAVRGAASRCLFTACTASFSHIIDGGTCYGNEYVNSSAIRISAGCLVRFLIRGATANAIDSLGGNGLIADGHIYSTVSHGIDLSSCRNSTVANVHVENCGGTAFRCTVAEKNRLLNCSGYNNLSNGNGTNWIDVGFISVTDGSVYTNAAAGDLSLNSTALRGALLRAAGWPGLYPAGLTTGYPDIGGVQHQDAGGGGSTVIVIEDE